MPGAECCLGRIFAIPHFSVELRLSGQADISVDLKVSPIDEYTYVHDFVCRTVNPRVAQSKYAQSNQSGDGTRVFESWRGFSSSTIPILCHGTYIIAADRSSARLD